MLCENCINLNYFELVHGGCQVYFILILFCLIIFESLTLKLQLKILIYLLKKILVGLPWWLRWKRICNAGDPCSIPGSGRSPGEGNGNPLQYSCLENSMGIGALWVIVHGISNSWTGLSD